MANTRVTTAGDTRVTSGGDTRVDTATTYLNVNGRAGVNLEELRYWQASTPFQNVLKHGLSMISHEAGGAWDDGRAITTNSDGYPTSLLSSPAQEVTLLFMTDQSLNYPAGNYRILFDGDGGWDGNTNANLEITNFGSVVSESDGEVVVNWTATDSNQYIRIVGVNGADPIVNMRILLPKYGTQTGTFTDEFKDSLSDFSGLRFMKWQNIKDSELVDTTDDTPETFITYGGVNSFLPGGCPLGIQADLCNETNTDYWLCVPHQATDAWVTAACTTIQGRLNSDLRVYVEFSNETWNPNHTQEDYCRLQGLARGLDNVPSAGDSGSDEFRGNRRFMSERSQEIFDLAAAVFGTGGRMVRVLGGWNANPFNNRLMMDWEHTTTGIALKDNCDALAVAPYFGSPLTNNPQAVTGPPQSPYAEVTVDMTPDDIVAHAAADSSSTDLWTDRTKTNIDDAASRGLDCVAYESGQHLAGATGGLQSNSTLTSLFTQANQHPDMRQAYYDDLSQFEDGGGGTNFLFQFTTRAGHGSGNWGLKEYQEDTDGPKWLGFQDWITESTEPLSVNVSKSTAAYRLIRIDSMDHNDTSVTFEGAYYEDALFFAVDGGAATNPSSSAELVVNAAIPGASGTVEVPEDANEVLHRRMSIDSSGNVTLGFLKGALPNRMTVTLTGVGASDWDVYAVLGRIPSYDRGR